ncbi:MAG: ferric reductase-like transmembrane domain-containing protein [Desulfobacter sp.]
MVSGHVLQKIMVAALAVLAAAGIAGAAAIPFFFESQSLYYKFGTDKALLQWGKAAGLVALVLMVYQVLLVSRFSFLEKQVSLKRLFALHKGGGILITLLVVLHPVMILGAEGFVLFPLERRYWPEFLGVFLVFAIPGIAAVSVWRAKLKIAFKPWQALHRIGTPLVTGLAFVHAFYVSETFGFRIPGTGLFLAAAVVLALLARIYIRRLYSRQFKRRQ